MRILLLQARLPSDPMLRHELKCFDARLNVHGGSLIPFNLTSEKAKTTLLNEVDMVMVGGSGDFSVVKGGFPWLNDFLTLLRVIVEREIPMFASCFGFQGLVAALGGTVESVKDRAELGTYRVRLTEEGQRDPVFRNLPEYFDAQLGHNDSATALPSELVLLAGTEACPFQAVRVAHTPIWATQFHPELTWEDNMQRYMQYLHAYRPPDISLQEAEAAGRKLHRPSPDSNRLLEHFVRFIQNRTA